MGKATILFIAAFSMGGMFYMAGTQRGVAATDEAVSDYQYEVLVRNAALAGYQQARQVLASGTFSGSQHTFSGSYDGCSYDVEIAQGASGTYAVRSYGAVQNGSGRTLTYTVYAEYDRDIVPTISDEAPAFMRYALLTDDDLSLDGDVLTDLYVQGDEANTLNANVHTNGNLFIRGNSVEVRGFGTYRGYGSSNPASALTESFDPNYNPASAPSSAWADSVEIPAYDAGLFASRIDVDDSRTGDVTLSGTHTFAGTREDPYVMHVTGSLTLQGGTRIDGYVLFLVDGNVSVSGNVEAGETGYDGSDESSIGIYAGGNLDLAGNARIYGQLFVGGTVSFMQGTPTVYGNLTTQGAATLRGTPQIYYRPASPALTSVFEPATIHLKLTAYSEW